MHVHSFSMHCGTLCTWLVMYIMLTKKATRRRMCIVPEQCTTAVLTPYLPICRLHWTLAWTSGRPWLCQTMRSTMTGWLYMPLTSSTEWTSFTELYRTSARTTAALWCLVDPNLSTTGQMKLRRNHKLCQHLQWVNVQCTWKCVAKCSLIITISLFTGIPSLLTAILPPVCSQLYCPQSVHSYTSPSLFTAILPPVCLQLYCPQSVYSYIYCPQSVHSYTAPSLFTTILPPVCLQLYILPPVCSQLYCPQSVHNYTAPSLFTAIYTAPSLFTTILSQTVHCCPWSVHFAAVLPHSQYVQNLMTWIEKQIANEEIFPVRTGESALMRSCTSFPIPLNMFILQCFHARVYNTCTCTLCTSLHVLLY